MTTEILWVLLAGVGVGGFLVLLGVFLSGWLVYKTRKDGASLFVGSTGGVEISDVEGAESFDEDTLFEKADSQNNEQFLKNLAAGKIK